MDQCINCNNNSRRQRRRLNKEQQPDRLSLLPDTILTQILSLLPINTSAATSVLSRRWRHVWTGVTIFHFDKDLSEEPSRRILCIVGNILRQMTHAKLHAFHLVLPSESNLDDVDTTEPCFLEIIRRTVDQIIFNAGFRSFFRVPTAFVFNAHSLINLKLIGMLKIDFLENAAIQLPNLKKLYLSYLIDVPLRLMTMFDSCPLLEDLHLSFDLVSMPQPQNVHSIVNIFAPNLKLLEICMISWSHLRRSKISIDAPKLAKLRIRDRYSFYCFIQNPTSLVDVSIDYRGDLSFSFNVEESEDGVDDVIPQMSKFFGDFCSVGNLELQVERHTNIFTCLHNVNMPIFYNLRRIKTNCFKDLILSLQYLPNLEHFEVSLWSEGNDLPMEQRDWCAPAAVPDCMVNKLRTIQIGGLMGIGDDLKMLAYLLSNAMVLEKLCIEVQQEYAVWKESKFCKSLFKLPSSSSTCEVVVSGRSHSSRLMPSTMDYFI